MGPPLVTRRVCWSYISSADCLWKLKPRPQQLANFIDRLTSA